jgi:hypothetical protein
MDLINLLAVSINHDQSNLYEDLVHRVQEEFIDLPMQYFL